MQSKARKQNVEKVTLALVEIMQRGFGDALESVVDGQFNSLTSAEVTALLQDPRLKETYERCLQMALAHVTK